MRTRTTLAAFAAAATIALTAACGGAAATSATGTTTTSSTVVAADTAAGTSTSAETGTDTDTGAGPAGGGPGMQVDLASVTTVAELDAVVQESYGEGSLGLHRGHQPIEDVLDEVLGISHDELHVRMDAGQNLAAVAEDLGIDPQTLVDALVEQYSPAVDAALEAGAVTEDEADAYLAALEESFTWRTTWDGEEATPTFSGVQA